MTRFFLRRVVLVVPTLAGVLIVAFLLLLIVLALWPALSVRDEQARSTVPAPRRA